MEQYFPKFLEIKRKSIDWSNGSLFRNSDNFRNLWNPFQDISVPFYPRFEIFGKFWLNGR